MDRYENALSAEEQNALAQVRGDRRERRDVGIRFLWIGRWSPEKGTNRLIKYLKRRLEARWQDSCTIAGCGADAATAVAAEFPKSPQIRVITSFRREELPSILAEHDVGLFTSSVEGWGLSLTEMVEAGMPVYATRTGGVVDLEPYLGGALRPFPPPIADDIDTRPLFVYWEHYYRVFSWSSIAKRYVQSLNRMGVTGGEPANT
jgi:glycosyltransferase involved in cell wall biosynthesis